MLAKRRMPGAEWFPGARLNFAEHILRNRRDGAIAIRAYSEVDAPIEVSWNELDRDVKILAQRLRELGVEPGDMIACYLPNIPQAVVAMLAAAAVGAVFSSCSPDFGSTSALDRFGQIEPIVLFCGDGYRFDGKDFDKRAEVAEIVSALPSLQHVIQVPYLFREDVEMVSPSAMLWDQVCDEADIRLGDFYFERVPFDHPLWILYSSGTTGLPKPIVHCHGGIVLEFLKLLSFHMNLKPDSGMFFYTTTGWMMWNLVVGAMITGATSVLYEGSPAGQGLRVLWHICADSRATFFGASPTFVKLMENHGVVPKELFDLSRVEGILLGGAPATPDSMLWCYENIKQDLWVTSQSGGTDVCSGFVGASPTLPVYAGEIQAVCLGVDARSFDANGNSITNEVGELVICQPMPSMPVGFLNDTDHKRYRESYFEDYEGVWRHGDYFLVNERGGCYIYGRSDSTLNRYGVRIGTAEIYRIVEANDNVQDSLIVNISLPDGEFFMPLFVQLRDGVALTDDLKQEIRSALRKKYSPRHVPDDIVQIDSVPYTLTNKKMEVPVRRLLAGEPEDRVINTDAMANPQSVSFFREFRQSCGNLCGLQQS